MRTIFRHGTVTASGLVVGLLLAGAACRADPAAQTRQAIQQVCDRSAASYQRMDLSGSMTMYSPACKVTDVVGLVMGYRRLLAGYAADFALPRDARAAHAVVHTVTLRGGIAYTRIDWHFASRTAAFTYTRDYSTRAVWVRRPRGWREVSAQMTVDTARYRQAPPPRRPTSPLT